MTLTSEEMFSINPIKVFVHAGLGEQSDCEIRITRWYIMSYTQLWCKLSLFLELWNKLQTKSQTTKRTSWLSKIFRINFRVSVKSLRKSTILRKV